MEDLCAKVSSRVYRMHAEDDDKAYYNEEEFFLFFKTVSLRITSHRPFLGYSKTENP